MPDSAEMGFTEPETTFSGFLRGFPAEAKATAARSHPLGVSFKFDRRCVDVSNIIGLAAVTVPRGVRWAVVGETIGDCNLLLVSQI